MSVTLLPSLCDFVPGRSFTGWSIRPFDFGEHKPQAVARLPFFDTHVRISLDVLRSRNHEKIFLNACLKMGLKFVVDNTNPSIADRKRYILPAKAADFELVGYFFESEIAEILKRNKTRPEAQRIPVKGIFATYHKLQPPSYDEGFDKLYRVKGNAQGLFRVEEWPDISG